MTRAVAWVAAFAGGAWALISLGRHEWLQVDWSDPVGWLDSAPPDVALAALARLAGLVLIGWVGASTLGYAFARILGFRPSRLRWLSIGPLRKAVDAVLAGSLLLTTVAPAAPVLAAQEPVTTTTEATRPITPSYVPVPAGDPSETADTGTADHPHDGEAEGPAAGEAVVVVVAPGDHFWGLASAHLAAILRRPPSDAEIVPYWLEVVDANRRHIRSGDPDLIYPGEEVVLPAFRPGS